MDLERRLVAQPAQGRRAVRDQVIVRGPVLALAEAGLVPDREPLRRRRRDVLLPEALRCGAVREALQVERPIGEVRQHRRGDAREVGDEVALGQGGLVDAVAGREQHLVEVGDLQLLPGDAPQALGLHRAQRVELGLGHDPGRIGRRRLGLRLRRRRLRRGRLRRSLRHRRRPSRTLHRRLDRFRCRERFSGLAIRLRRVDRALTNDLARVAPALEALERRLAHVAVAGPATDLRADDELGPDPADARRGRRPTVPDSPGAGGGSNTGASVSRASSSPRSSFRVRASNPDPTLPENFSLSSS